MSSTSGMDFGRVELVHKTLASFAKPSAGGFFFEQILLLARAFGHSFFRAVARQEGGVFVFFSGCWAQEPLGILFFGLLLGSFCLFFRLSVFFRLLLEFLSFFWGVAATKGRFFVFFFVFFFFKDSENYFLSVCLLRLCFREFSHEFF